MVLVRPERLDLDWARHNLVRVWRAQAPKRVLLDFDGPGRPVAQYLAEEGLRVTRVDARLRAWPALRRHPRLGQLFSPQL